MATLLFTVNPFVYERMASGQVYVVMGYSLLPILLALVIRPLQSIVATAALGGLIFTLDIALSVHYLFIAGLLLAIMILVHAALRQGRVVRTAVGVVACAAVLNLYWLIPAARATRTMQSHVTGQDLSAFQTVGDPMWGLAVNVAGLYGFWRSGPPLVKDYISGWPFLMFAILIVAGFGLCEMCARVGSAERGLALSCAVLAVVGALFALGARGPTGGMYAWFFDHLPGFKVMREAEKFSALVALSYASCFGAGAQAVARPLAQNILKALCAVCIAVVPLAYGCTELWGFAAYARPSVYPASWARADRTMSPGATALALPFRSYLQVPWEGNRVVANPLQGYFGRPVISADDLEAGPIETETSNPRSVFLEFCLSEGNRLSEFGRLLAPLGIRYVILARVPGAQSLGWLNRQHDMRRVFSSNSIDVYRNEEVVRAAYEPARSLELRDWGQVLGLAQRVPLTSYLIQVRHARPGPLDPPTTMAVPPRSTSALIAATGEATAQESVAPQTTTRTVVLTDPAYAGWHLDGFRTTSQFGVAVAFTRKTNVGHPGELLATYAPWRLVEVCDIVGVCLAIGDVALFVISLIHYRRRRKNC